MRLLFFALTLLLAGALSAQDQAAKGQTVRPEVGKPIQSAIDLLKAKRGKEALARVREAQAVHDKTPYESYIVERVFAQAAAMAGDAAAAARAFEAVAASPAAPEAERRQFLAAAAGQYYVAKDYAKAAETASRYLKQGGTDKSVRTMYIQALYLGNNFAAAAKAIAPTCSSATTRAMPKRWKSSSPTTRSATTGSMCFMAYQLAPASPSGSPSIWRASSLTPARCVRRRNTSTRRSSR
jgi:hypothetical protein